MAPPRHINIGPYSFPIRAGYTDALDGFAVGPPELEVLDTARAERVRKKAFKVYEKLRAKSPRKTLSELELRHLGAQITEFDASLRLERIADPRGFTTERPARRAPDLPAEVPPDLTAGEFDSEVLRLAELRIAAEETTRGETLPPSARAAALTALCADPLIREAARARIEAVMLEREKLLEDLF